MIDVLILVTEVAAVVIYVALTVAVVVLVVKGLQWFRKWMVER